MPVYTLVWRVQKVANQHGAPIWNLKHQQIQIFASIVLQKHPHSQDNPVILESNFFSNLFFPTLFICGFYRNAFVCLLSILQCEAKLTKWVKLFGAQIT